MAKTYDFLFKLLLIGDSDVGKAAILYRFVENSLAHTFIMEIGRIDVPYSTYFCGYTISQICP